MNQPKKHVSAVFLVLLLVLVGPSTYVQSRTVTYGPVTFQPATNETTVDANITSIQVPANHTITSGFVSFLSNPFGKRSKKTVPILVQAYQMPGPTVRTISPPLLRMVANCHLQPIPLSDHSPILKQRRWFQPAG